MDVTPVKIFSVGDICSIIGSVPSTTAGWIWTAITNLGFWYSALIVLGLVGWVIFEIVTRYTTTSYRSDNGFTPLFNVFVGGSVNFGIQELLGLLLAKMFSDAAYCVAWPYALHVSVFVATGLLLRFTGFWTYLRILGESPRKRGRNKR